MAPGGNVDWSLVDGDRIVSMSRSEVSSCASYGLLTGVTPAERKAEAFR